MSTGLRTALVACVLAGLALPGIAADIATIKEPSTGVAFESTRTFAGASAPLALTGVGLRKKYGIAKVYAFALYVDPAAAKTGLAAFKGRNADALRKDAASFRAVVELKGDRAAVMHFVRTVDAEAMRGAMTEAMDRGVPAGDPARKQFLDLWTDEIKEGEEVVLVFGANGSTVGLVRGGKTVGTVESAALSRSLLQSWLGPEPVSDDIQKGVMERVPALL